MSIPALTAVGALATLGFASHTLYNRLMVPLYGIIRSDVNQRRCEAEPLRCCTDCMTAGDAEALLRRICRGREADSAFLVAALIRIYERFPPVEKSRSAMCALQRALEGTGGPAEFSVCTVYASMLISSARADGTNPPFPVPS